MWISGPRHRRTILFNILITNSYVIYHLVACTCVSQCRLSYIFICDNSYTVPDFFSKSVLFEGNPFKWHKHLLFPSWETWACFWEIQGFFVSVYLPNLLTIWILILSDIQIMTWLQNENKSVSLYIEKICVGKVLTTKDIKISYHYWFVCIVNKHFHGYMTLYTK